MSIFGRHFPFIGKKTATAKALPTVKFDASRVTIEVRDYLQTAISALPDISTEHLQTVYDAALESVSRGRDLGLLCTAILKLELAGMTKARAADIARSLNQGATALMTIHRQRELGITKARWLYSGAPCTPNSASLTEADLRQDAAHKAASGKVYPVDQGMFLDGKWTYPGSERDCKCASVPVIPGFD